jgi:WXXGXW repeat (2 copies)
MKDGCLVGLLLGMALTAPAPAQVSVYVGITPPPIPREPPPPPPPAVGMIWVGGFWAPQGHHYRWVAGRYQQPPYPGATWSHPHYDHYPEGWRFDEGHWGHEDHDHGHGQPRGHDRGNDDGGHGHD